MILLEAKEITKQFAGHKALDKVSLSIPPQSIYGLLGPNGAGKTTMIRIINQITGPDTGTIYLNGRRLVPSDVASIGYLPEERGLYKKMKVGEQVLYFARLKGLSKYEALRRMKMWFNKFDITNWYHKKVEELSKGMQQKAQFVSTIIHEPQLLIFDEPFSGFDPVNANLIKNEILNLREKGATVIFSTHNMSSVEELCDNITLIDKSRTILEGRVDEIRKKWAGNEYDISFEGDIDISNNNILKAISKKKENGWSVIRIKTEEGVSTNNILSAAMNAGTVTGFQTALPSMNEIFIRAVEAKTVK
jgi:ABC-2 type transport system ATP-binding protein